VIYTGVFISVLPLVIVYVVFRRWFISGVMAGAVKG
jgi:ABC-type glycerol-3-phosphate transport system permease component